MNTPIEEHPYLLTLSSCPGIGPIHAKKLLLTFGSARKCMEAKKIDWVQKGGLSSKQAENLNTHRRTEINAKKKDSEYYHKLGIRIISILDDNFPVRLKHWIDCPILLFIKGNIELNPLRTLAIIGTRKPNGISIELTKKLIHDCTQHNITIVSGLAYGIDITAHRECITQGIPTQAVLAHGLEQIYPKAHSSEASELQGNGGLITEMPLHTKLHPDLFPRRNRIVAGLCDAVVVIESKIIGGSMSTAQIARSYDREVFAFPGNPIQGHNSGCNALIKRNVAQLVESFDDIAKNMNWQRNSSSSEMKQIPLLPELNEDEQLILHALTGQALHIDQLMNQIHIPLHRLTLSTLELELKGLIKVLPGKYYQRLA